MHATILDSRVKYAYRIDPLSTEWLMLGLFSKRIRVFGNEWVGRTLRQWFIIIYSFAGIPLSNKTKTREFFFSFLRMDVSTSVKGRGNSRWLLQGE